MNSRWRCVFLSLKADLMSCCDCLVDELMVTDQSELLLGDTLTLLSSCARSVFFATLPFVFFFVFLYHCNWIIWLAKNWNVHSQWNSYPSLWTHSWSWLRHTHWSVLEHNLVWVVMYEISLGSLLRLSVFMTLCVGMQIPFQIRFHFCSRLDKQHKWVTWVLIWSDH